MQQRKWILIFVQLWMLGFIDAKNSPPHIIFILADDLGWNDVSFHGSPQIPTPNIDALAKSGIVLNNYYASWVCTPSRGQLLSGRNAIRLGVQHSYIKPGENSGLPLDIVTLPKHLKSLGYSTHMIGKWHLGYATKAYTPVHRGFDSFLGYYNGNLDYFDYTMYDKTELKNSPIFWGIDFQDNNTVIKDYRARYITDTFTDRAEEIIRRHDSSKPLFLFFSETAVHTGQPMKPQEAPPKFVSRVKYIRDVKRRMHAGSAVALDDSVGKVFQTLHDKDMLENTIVVFASDNGGETSTKLGGYGSNYPLRGNKATLWEGGVRVPAVVWSPLFNLKTPRVSKQLFHVTDWLPTFYKVAGGDLNDLEDIDGMDMWEALLNDSPSPRKEILYNIDPVLGVSALREGDMKVINGSSGYNSWYNPTHYDCFNANKTDSNCHFVDKGVIRDLLKKSGRWILEDVQQWRRNASITCSQPPPKKTGGNCNPSAKPCLFNVNDDPCEYENLADKNPDVVERLMNRITEYQKTAVSPQNKASDPRANPLCHDFAHVPWLDPEFYDECTEYV